MHLQLTLKQLVVKEDPLFIFEDPGKAANALMELRMSEGTREATLLDLLRPEHDVMTVGYRQLVNRAAKLLVIKELLPSHKHSSNRTLRDDVDDLVAKRNRLMHSVAVIDMQSDAELLLKVVEPFYELASKELGDTPFRYSFYVRLTHPLRRAQYWLKNYAPKIGEKERWVLDIVMMFHGQLCPGELFGQENDLQLPDFTKSTIRREPASRTFLVSGESESWLVVAELEYRNKEQIAEVLSHSKRYPATLWLITDTGVYTYPETLVSDVDDVRRLEQLLVTDQN